MNKLGVPNPKRPEGEFTNSENPHVAVIRVDIVVHDKLPSGELSGRAAHKETTTLSISGETKAVCLQRLSDFLGLARKECD